MNGIAKHALITASMLAIGWFSAASALASNAATDRPELVAKDGKALVVFCRASALKGVAWGHDYYIDGLHVAKLSSGAYTQVDVTARDIIVGTGPKRNPTFRKATISAEAGRIYYVVDDPGNSFASYETLIVTDSDICVRRSKKFQSPIVGSVE